MRSALYQAAHFRACHARAERIDGRGLEQADDAFGEGVIKAVANATDRCVNSFLRQAFSVLD